MRSCAYDAVHVHNVANVVDRDKESEAEILWSTYGLIASILKNQPFRGAEMRMATRAGGPSGGVAMRISAPRKG